MLRRVVPILHRDGFRRVASMHIGATGEATCVVVKVFASFNVRGK
jgi:hypothetical protein